MSGVRITVTVDDRSMRQGLLELAARGRQLAPAFRSIGELMLRSTDRRFSTQVSPDGVPWAAISTGWREAKRRNRHLSQILQMRGRLRGSIAYRATNDEVAIGTNVIYGAIHQLGGDIEQGARLQVMAFRGSVKKPGKFLSRAAAGKSKKAVTIRVAQIAARTITMPARPYLGISIQDRTGIARIIARHLAGGDA